MDVDVDAVDLVGGQLVFIAKLNASVDHRVDHEAASVRLVGVAVDLETVAEAVGDDGEIVFGADQIGPAAFRLDALQRAGKTFLGEKGGQHAVLRRAAGMKALGHRAEHFPNSDRLRCRQPDRVAHPLFVEPEDPAGRNRSAEYAGRTGGVPADVAERRLHRARDPAFRLEAHHHRGDEVAPVDRLELGQRE